VPQVNRRELMRTASAMRRWERLNEGPNKQLQRQASGDPAAARSEAVRKLKTQLRKLMKWLHHDRHYPYNFYCECGCCEPVPLTIEEYDALGGKTVYRAGHAPLEKRYGATIRPGDE
jgi:hypothetical protein